MLNFFRTIFQNENSKLKKKNYLYNFSEVHNLNTKKRIRPERELRQQYVELQQNRDALVISEQRYKLIVEGANDGIWDWDVRNDLYFFSLKWKNTFGYSDRELGNSFETWKSLLHPEDIQTALKRLEEYMESKKGIYTSTYRLRCKNGDYRWVLSRGKGIWDNEGKAVRLAGSHTDITEQIELQEHLRKEKEFSESVLNNVPIIVFVWEKDGTIVRINSYACKVLGYTQEEAIGKRWVDILAAEENREYMKSLLDNIKQSKMKKNYEVQIMCKDGSIIDALWNNSILYNWDGSIQGIVSIGTDITDRKLMEKQLYNMAYYDYLTGLPNRMLLEEEIEKLIKEKEIIKGKIALLYLDIDNFKHINDLLGHISGDTLMKYIANILKYQIKPPDIKARLGGDEFVIVLTNIMDKDDIVTKIEELLNYLRRPWVIENQEFYISISIGIALFPEHGKDLNTLLKNADTAMYAAKEKGKDTYSFYNKYMHEKTLEYINMANRLRHAIQGNEFNLYYQPQVDLQTHEIVGVEALIRWFYPEEGFISPEYFIPVAEEIGHILDIGKWVCETAFKQKRVWEEKGFQPIKMSINLSKKSLLSSNLVQNISALSRLYKVNCHDIQVEITETDIITDLNAVITVLNQLKELGIKIALDDFGTGYSSLNYLKELPIDILKIDQILVNKIIDENQDEVIIKTIIQLAHELNLKVVAEGIENEKQLTLLKKYNCDIGQGYLFYKALPVEEIEKLLE
ncbi:MAG TPA: EAL domain-containing protein [Clostridiaceae bacterium]|nr:EAL domain-containing protein [Clostridiaceae bacterium]